MKNTIVFLLTAFMSSSAGYLNADLIHAVGVDNYTRSGPFATNYSLITSWVDVGVDGTAQSFTSGPISGSVDGVSFSYTISVTAAGGSGNLSLQSGDTLGTNGTLFAGTQGFSLSIGSISDSAVLFDGFTQFGSNGAAGGEGANVGGINYTRSSTAVEPAWILLNAPEPSFTYDTTGTTAGRYVEFQFSSIPEPTSAAILIGLGSALMFRRRRSAV